VEILGGAVNFYTNIPLVADFNQDGIDDLFLPGFSDSDQLVPSMAFISRRGQSHIRVDLPDPVYAHGATVIDVDNDGDLDVVDSWGNAWFNDGTGSFRFGSIDVVQPFYVHGSGVCAGDFNNTGRSQLVLTDQMLGPEIRPIADTVIFELGQGGLPVAQHYLPVPVLDRNSTSVEISHDVTCKTVDINKDGLLDILVFSRPLPVAGGHWTDEGTIQVLINKGNWRFEDQTESVLPTYNTKVALSYTAVITDLNNDGKPDLWASNFDFTSGNSNQAFLNNGSGIFRSSLQTTLASFGATGGMLPVKFGDRWAFVFLTMHGYDRANVFLTRPLYTFN
jgi:hypothetical protein